MHCSSKMSVLFSHIHTQFCCMNSKCNWLLSGIQSSAFTENVARSSQGSTCEASTEFSNKYSCWKAIDGDLNSDWASREEGIRAWIQITLPQPVYVIRIKATNRKTGGGDEVKRASLLFDNNQTGEVTNYHNLQNVIQYSSV